MRTVEAFFEREGPRDDTRADVLVALLESITDAVYLLDRDWRFIYLNAPAEAMFRRARSALLGTSFWDLLTPPLGAIFRDEFGRAAATGQAAAFEVAYEPRDLWFEVRAYPARAGLTVYAQEITSRKRAQAAIAASEARYRLLLEQASDGIFVLGDDGRFVEVNARACAMLGYARAELLGLTTRDVIAPGDLAARPMAEAPRVGYLLDERTMRRKDGTVFPAEAGVSRLPDGQRQAIVRDISERKALEAQLRHQAFHDALTGLPNRARFLDRLDQALAAPGDAACALLFLDLDRFKAVNDSLGHAAGDQLLVAVAARLAGCLRPGDTLARLGGDEFALLLPDVSDPAVAVSVAEAILAAVRAPLPLEGRELIVTASVGIALRTPEVRDPQALLRCADVALCRAKAAGRAGHAVFAPGMNADALARLELEHDLRLAVERGAVAVHYQPKVDLTSGAITELEALARWHHPTRGPIPPGVFIRLAEETGLIVALGRQVLTAACRQLVRWRHAHPGVATPTLAVNLSARQFRHAGLAADVAAILAATGLDAALLQLEITETAAMEHPDEAIATLRALKALGVRLALDDFGTGYSSLAYLQHLPVDALKIDRSFFRAGAANRAIVRAATELAHGLGLDVTAEGLETADQVAWAREAGCDLGQGFYFARALPEEFAALWAAGRTFDLPHRQVERPRPCSPNYPPGGGGGV